MKCTVTYTLSEQVSEQLLTCGSFLVTNLPTIRHEIAQNPSPWQLNHNQVFVREYVAFFPAIKYRVLVSVTNHDIDISAYDDRKELGRRLVSQHILHVLSDESLEIIDLANGFRRERSILTITDLGNTLASLVPSNKETTK
jgi:hypothetical protein